MKVRNIINRAAAAYDRAGQYIGATVVALIGTAANAQTDPFATALASVTDKTEEYASALVGFAAVAVVFMIAVKYVKKLPKAS